MITTILKISQTTVGHMQTAKVTLLNAFM